MFNFLHRSPKSFLGVDIGTTGIKVVQLGGEKNNPKLETYGLVETCGSLEFLNGSLESKSKNSTFLNGRVSGLLKEILDKSKATAKQTAMSVPVFSTFSALIELPDMPENEIESAIFFEARRYIPISLDEVILGWDIVNKNTSGKTNGIGAKNSETSQILLVAISKEIAKKYAQIAKSAGLKLTALETESFSLARSLIKKEDVQGASSVIIADVGSMTTNIVVVDKGSVIKNHSVDVSGDEITRAISYGLGVNFDRAESFKRSFGLEAQNVNGKKIFEITVPIIETIVTEIKKMMDYYSKKRGGQFERVILVGGSANLKGLSNYFSKRLGLTVELGDPWRYLSYPEPLTPVLREIAPSFSVAIGLAMKGFDEN